MKITEHKEGNTVILTLEGRLDNTTSETTGIQIIEKATGMENLTLDLAKVDYISSAGLAILLKLQKTLCPQTNIVLMNIQKEVLMLFEITGFTQLFKII